MKINKRIVLVLLFVCSISYSQTKTWGLEECIQYAIDHNLEVKQQLFELEDAKIATSNAKGNYLPNLSASARNTWSSGLSNNALTGGLEFNTIRNSSYGLNSSIPIYNGMQNYHTLQQAKLQEISNQFSIEKAKDDIKLNVANSFLELLLQKENIGILKTQYEFSLEQLKRTKEMVALGTLPKGDEIQLEATVAKDLQNIAQAENSYIVSELGLKRLLNFDLSNSFTIKSEEVGLGEMKMLETPVNEIVDKVLTYRNEMKLSETNIEIAQKGVEIAKGNYLPTLSGFINYGTTEQSSKDWENYLDQLKNNYGLSYGVSLSIPIFNRFQTRNSVKKSKLNVLKSENQLEQTKQKVSQDVYQAYSNAKATYKTYQASIKAVAAQKNAFEYQQVKYEVGESNLLDFLQNRTEYQNSQTELLRAKYNLLFGLKILELYYLGY